jgi:hypothetical protein
MEMAIHIAEFYGRNALDIGPGTSEFRQFQSTDHRPYAQRILRNAEAIRNNIQGTLGLLTNNLPAAMKGALRDDNDDWQIIELAVTSHIEIAAFVNEPLIPFVAIDHLKEIFMADDSPPSGWWTPWHHEAE